jgi:hypothetical protein
LKSKLFIFLLVKGLDVYIYVSTVIMDLDLKKLMDPTRVSDPDPDWIRIIGIRIQSGQWILIWIGIGNPDPGGKK